MKSKVQDNFLNTLTWSIVIISLLPIVWMVLSSLRSVADINDGAQLSQEAAWHWSNYRDMWVNVDFLNYFVNSLIVCGATTILATICASFAAYALARFRFRGAQTTSLMISITQVIPGMLFFCRCTCCTKT